MTSKLTRLPLTLAHTHEDRVGWIEVTDEMAEKLADPEIEWGVSPYLRGDELIGVNLVAIPRRPA